MTSTLYDPTIEQFVYYNWQYELFEEELQSVYSHLYNLICTSPPALSLLNPNTDRKITQRLVHTGWQEVSAFSFSLEARTLGNNYYLQVAYRANQAGIQSYTHLRHALWTPKKEKGFLGESIFLHGLACRKAEVLIHPIFCEYTGRNLKEVLEISYSHFSWGQLYKLVDYNPQLFVLLYATSEGRNLARVLLDQVISRLELYNHIGRKKAELYERDIRPMMKKMQQETVNAITHVNRPTRNLDLLEKRLSRVTTLSQNYVNLLGRVNDCKTEITIIKENIETEIKPSFDVSEDRILTQYLRRIQSQVNQIQADLNSYLAKKEQLASAYQTLRTQVEILGKRGDRRIIWLMLLFAIITSIDNRLSVIIMRATVALLVVAIILIKYHFFKR